MSGVHVNSVFLTAPTPDSLNVKRGEFGKVFLVLTYMGGD